MALCVSWIVCVFAYSCAGVCNDFSASLAVPTETDPENVVVIFTHNYIYLCVSAVSFHFYDKP